MASISIRDYIYYLPYPLPAGTPVPYTPGLPSKNPLNGPPQPLEPTSTLVLTSPSKSFVDLRIFKPIAPADAPLPNDGGHRERLDWAFAGKSSSTKVDGDDSITKASWTHWVDSRYSVGTPAALMPKDEGIMYAMSETQTLEHGSAPNFQTGAMQSYEEMWTDLPILPCSPSRSKYAVVLRLDNAQYRVRGVVVRLGQFCQGIVMKEKYCTIERWQFKRERESEAGEWKRVARIGDQMLPCATTFKPEGLIQGGKIRYGDYEWEVDELVGWSDD